MTTPQSRPEQGAPQARDIAADDWRAASTLDDVLPFVSRWFEGRLPLPGVLPPGDIEVALEELPTVPPTTAVIRAQRGCDEGWRELRTAVEILAPRELAGAVARECRAAGLLAAVADHLTDVWARGVPLVRWGEEPARRVDPSRDVLTAIASSLQEGTSREFRRAMSTVLIVDPCWADDSRLWPIVRGALGRSTPRPQAQGGDVFAVDRRLRAARRSMDTAIDEWLSHLLVEIEACAHDLVVDLAGSPLVRLSAAQTDGAPRLAAATVADGPMRSPRRLTVPDASIGPLELVWRELVDAVRIRSGVRGSTSLVVSPREGVVLAWFPQTCVVHSDLEPVAWCVADRATEEDGPPADVDDARDIPHEVSYVLARMRRHGITPPTEATSC